jgi:hypothetical protein
MAKHMTICAPAPIGAIVSVLMNEASVRRTSLQERRTAQSLGKPEKSLGEYARN